MNAVRSCLVLSLVTAFGRRRAAAADTAQVAYTVDTTQVAYTVDTTQVAYAVDTVPYAADAADTAQVAYKPCCNVSHPAITVCLNRERLYHAIEKIGPAAGKCGDVLWSVRKCCPPDQAYDPETQVCRPGDDDDGGGGAIFPAFRRTLRLDRFRGATVGYVFEAPKCGAADVLIDVSADEADRLSRDRETRDTPQHFCLDLRPSSAADPRQRLVARTCVPRDQYCRVGAGYTCANKCCKDGKVIVNKSCKKNGTVPFAMPIYEAAAAGDGEQPVLSNRTRLLAYYNRLKCYKRYTLADGTYNLLSDGSLHRSDTGARVPAAKYCLEYTVSDERPGVRSLDAFVCLDDWGPLDADGGGGGGVQLTAEEAKGSWKYVVTLAGFVPSIACLALTLVVYAMLSSLRNVHGCYVMCYVACLLMSFVCLLVIQWMTDDIGSVLCKLFGYITLFAFLTTFCWLNVICFDIYWTLRYNNSINKHTSLSMRTVIYNIYCWGFSSVCVITAFLFQHSENDLLLKYAPNIGNYSCWFFETNYGAVIFFLLPVSTMLISNLILFVLTAIHCSRIKSELNKFKRTDSKKQRFNVDKEKFVMSIKLFLVMGIPWSVEILSRIFHNKWIIWDILDEINALQGVMIFLIFVAKRQVITSLRKKFNGSFENSESTKMHTISGSSQSGSTNKYNNDF